MPSADVRVFTTPPRRQPSGSITCVVNRELQLDPDILANYCFNDLTPLAFDLALVAGAVAFTDRIVPRTLSTGWVRRLRLSVPVSSERWHRPEVQRRLWETLHLLTGDSWEIRFRFGRSVSRQSAQSVLRFQHPSAVAMPYSDGLDSFAVARLLQHSSDLDGQTLILVTTGARIDVDQGQARGRVRVAVPFRLSESRSTVRLREPSYRSRAFVYGALAGLAVNLAGGTRVLIPESGQSSLGPALCPIGGEALDLRSHPRFTQKLAGFLTCLLEAPITFEHPRLWSTKGETLTELSSRGLADRWQLTWSCPRSTRHVRLGGKKVHCGVCAACLLRRQSLLRAGLHEAEPYQWPKLIAPSLSEAAADNARPTNKDDFRHAACGALCMDSFAKLALESNDVAFRQAVSDMPPVLGGREQLMSRLRRLVCAHQTEWAAFVASQGDRSYLHDVIGRAS